MAKQKEIKFQERHGALRGRQNGMEFWIRKDGLQSGDDKQEYFVVIYPESNDPHRVSTEGCQNFDLAGAKEFCQQIAAGEIDLENIQAFYDAQDAAKERAAVQEVTEKAKKFHARLDAMGLKYIDLLKLEAMRHALGEMGRNILLGYERGDGWPTAADQTKSKQEPETGESSYWALFPVG